jgi:protein gp37
MHQALAYFEQIRASIKGLSIEPLIERIVLPPGVRNIDVVIVGCESGPNRRPCKLEWIRSIVEQCKDAGVCCFVKQVNIDGKVVTDPALFPEDVRLRQYPGKE